MKEIETYIGSYLMEFYIFLFTATAIGLIIFTIIDFRQRYRQSKLKERFSLVICPNCGRRNFLHGPSGRGSLNVQCKICLKYYNYMVPFGLQEIGDRSDVFGIKPSKRS